jgi:hypothetical protein
MTAPRRVSPVSLPNPSFENIASLPVFTSRKFHGNPSANDNNARCSPMNSQHSANLETVTVLTVGRRLIPVNNSLLDICL